MIIKTVTFEVKAAANDKFEQKFRNDAISLKNWETCLGNEVWIQDNSDTNSVSFTAVSRWDNQDDFKAWLKRPEHIQHHKEQHFRKEDSPILKKSVQEYIVLED